MEIELFYESTKAIISADGGYVTNLMDDRGDILFPKRTMIAPDGSEKVRGGCHVCLPQFGPGGESGLAQHGYGRSSIWTIAAHTETTLDLNLAGQGAYEDLRSTLHYELTETSLQMQLTLENAGTVPLAVAPGFHPYFFTGGTEITLDDVAYKDLSEFEGVEFVSGDVRHAQIAGRELTMYSTNLGIWAEWTDQLGNYFCIEPTQSGFSFVEESSRADMLGACEQKSYSLTIEWSDLKK